MPIVGGSLSGWHGGAPQGCRYLIDIIKALGEVSFDEQVEALRRSPKAVKELAYLAYGPHELGISIDDVDPRDEVISQKAFEGRQTKLVEHYESGESGDLLYDEAERRLVKIFCLGVGPAGLTEEKRTKIFKDICARLRADEGELLHVIFSHRAIPGIPRRSVDVAWPGFLGTKRSPQVAEGPRYDWGL
jgi:hypothetical protein